MFIKNNTVSINRMKDIMNPRKKLRFFLVLVMKATIIPMVIGIPK